MSNNDDSENVGIALALVFGAGASTGLGAAVVFFPSIVKLASRRVLAGSLGFSAGVMTYVSFVEIFQKASSSFIDAGHEESTAYFYSTLCFFSGVLVMMILNVIVAKLLGGHGHHQPEQSNSHTHTHNHTHDDNDEAQKQTNNEPSSNPKDNSFLAQDVNDGGVYNPPCCSKDPVGRLEKMQTMAAEIEKEGVKSNDENNHNNNDENNHNDADDGDGDDDFVDNLPVENNTTGKNGDKSSTTSSTSIPAAKAKMDKEEENKKLVKMGVNTAVAIGLHNFPEGLATFVAALDDPKVGAILAFAIAIHNIPEGLCVALPIFYATGNRMKAFLWALLSGASELVAALLGWAILANAFGDNLYGVLFGMVGGMMVIISIRELLPTAHFYDPEDSVVTFSYIGGMALMAFSLVLFQA